MKNNDIILECSFIPGVKPKYTWISTDDRTGKLNRITIDRKTFLKEHEIHGEPKEKEVRFTEENVIIFKYHFFKKKQHHENT